MFRRTAIFRPNILKTLVKLTYIKTVHADDLCYMYHLYTKNILHHGSASKNYYNSIPMLKLKVTLRISWRWIVQSDILIMPTFYLVMWTYRFRSQRTSETKTWGPSGTSARQRGSLEGCLGHKGPVYKRPRCVGAERPRTHLPINQSTLLWHMHFTYSNLYTGSCRVFTKNV
jgi:hypothetical protein